MENHIYINDKYYPLWEQFVFRKEEWIGGLMQDFGDSVDRGALRFEGMETKIVDIQLRANGDSAFFQVVGEKFTCGFGVKYGGIVGGKSNWLTFSGYSGHQWRIQRRDEVDNSVNEILSKIETC
jgi:hypothetical protein